MVSSTGTVAAPTGTTAVIVLPTEMEDVTPEFYDERIATNLRHMFFTIQAVAPGMIAAGGGSLPACRYRSPRN